MLIKKLKQYSKQSQQAPYMPSGPAPNNMPALIQENLYTSGSEYQLPDGTEYIGFYHVHPVTGAMVGATHISGPHDSLTPISTTVVGGALVQRDVLPIPSNIPATSSQISQYVPTPEELLEYEKYIVSGSTYKSNIDFVNNRDTKGNISLNESGSNDQLLFESVTNNFTNRSVVSSIDTQFKYFKFPAQISANIDDIKFDESLLDVDIQQGILNDPYQGKLIRSAAAGAGGDRFFVQGLVKRKFFVKADSTWALKNNLPPFANIAGNISGKDSGEDNFFSADPVTNINTGWSENTVLEVPASVFDGYDIGSDYTPEDAFPEGNVYGKISFKTSIANNGDINDIPVNKFLVINGPKFGFMTYNKIRETIGQFRFAEFVAEELSNSYIGISIENFNNSYSELGDYNIGSDNDPFGPYRSIYINSGLFNTTAESMLDILIDGSTPVIAIGEKLKFDTTNSTVSAQEYINLNSKVLRKTLDGSNTNTYSISNLTSPFDNDYVGLNGESLSTVDGPKYIWYKLTLTLNRTGAKYRLLQGENNLSSELRDRDGNKNNNSSADLLTPEKEGDSYRGWVLNMSDAFPDGFPPNTSQNFEIEFLSNQSTLFDIDVYFIGWGTLDTTGNITNYNIVQESLRFDPPDLTTLTMPIGPS